MENPFEFILTIDQGNSFSKCALHSSDKTVITKFELDKLADIITIYNLDNSNTLCVKASVTDKEDVIQLSYTDVKNLFKNKSFLDMPVHYSETIGLDRLVAAYFCFIQSEKSFLVIDTGTFTTVDYVDTKGFNGGYILPGLKGLQDCYLNGSLLSVPSITNERVSTDFPNTTEKAIHQGVLISYLTPIKEIISQAKPSNILITGGNGSVLYNYLKELNNIDISIGYEKDLIHKALAEIAIITKTEF